MHLNKTTGFKTVFSLLLKKAINTKPSEMNSSFLKPCQRKNTFALDNDFLPVEEWGDKADHLSNKTPM